MSRRNTWQDIREEVRRRIHRRDWAPGEMIPNEITLAGEFGCSRATMNRALRSLASDGLIDRRRKGGTRVALHPVRRAVFEIPVLRHEIEETGAVYGYRLVLREMAAPLGHAAPGIGAGAECLHLVAVHSGDGQPHAIEDRWIDPALPGLADAPFEGVSANEWLLEHVPYTSGELTISAESADAGTADLLGLPQGTPLLCLNRVTLDGARIVTSVRLSYRPGHRLTTLL